MESRAISPSEMALPYAYAQLAPSDAVEEYRSGAGVRWRAFVAVLAASAVVVLLVASVLAGSNRVKRVVGGDVVADMPPLARGAGAEMPAYVSEKTSGATNEMGFLGTDADGFPWSKAMLPCSAPASIFAAREKLDELYLHDPSIPPAINLFL